MRILWPIVLAYLALALQSTLVPYIGIGGARPDLPLVAVVLIALSRGPAAGTLAGFLVGLAQDLTNPAFLGLNALAKCLLGHVAGNLKSRFDTATLASYAALLAGAVMAHDLVYLTVYTRLVLSEMFQELVTGTLPRALYTAAVGAVIGVVLDALSGRRLYRFGRSRFAQH
jgi:rod shape-determining protein MreD